MNTMHIYEMVCNQSFLPLSLCDMQQLGNREFWPCTTTSTFLCYHLLLTCYLPINCCLCYTITYLIKFSVLD